MSLLTPGSPDARITVLRDFSGGLSYAPQGDNEFEYFTNWDLQRDGIAVQRLGVWKLNSGSMGSSPAVGIGVVTAGNSPYLVVAKPGTTWYATALPLPNTLITSTPGPVSFSSITVPASPLTDPVRMESTITIAGVNVAVFVNPNITPFTWDGTTATNISGAPTAKYVRWYRNRLYLAGLSNPYAVRYSELGDPTNLPATLEFILPARFGRITGIEELSNGLVFFCERAILQMEGLPPSVFPRPLHSQVGCELPQTICTYGNVCAFMSQGQSYQLAGDLVLMSDRVAGRRPTTVTASLPGVWGALHANYYVLGASTPISTMAQGTTGLGYVWSMSRRRPGVWTDWTYDTAASIGTTTAYLPALCIPDGGGLVIGGNDGNVYAQPFRDTASYALGRGLYTDPVEHPDGRPVGPDSPPDAVSPLFTKDVLRSVVATIRTRRMDQGDPLLVKRMRQVLIQGVGHSITVVIRRWPVRAYELGDAGFTGASFSTDGDIEKQEYYESVYSFDALPCEINMQMNEPGGTDYSEMQIDIYGSALWLKSVIAVWQAVRFAGVRRVGG